MERYFDAFLYLANWGTHVLKLRLPAHLLDAKTARMHCVGEQVSVREKKGKVIVSFVSEDEEGDDWVAEFSNAEKDELLARMITGDTALASELLQRMRREHRWESLRSAPR
jgi:hypothetical protein